MVHHFFNLLISVLAYIGVFHFGDASVYQPFHDTEIILFLLIYSVISFLFSIYFTPKNYKLKERTQSAVVQFIFTLFSLSLVASLGDFKIPRYFVFIIVFIPVSLRWLIGFYFQDLADKKNGYISDKRSFQLKRLIASFVILFLAFIITLYSKTGLIAYYNWLEQIMLLLIALWWVSGHITRKFFALDDYNIYYKIAPIIKSQVLFLLFSSALYYFLELEHLSRQLFFGTIGVFSFLESSTFLLVFMKNKSKGSANVYEELDSINEGLPFIPKTNGKDDLLITENCLSQMFLFIKDRKLISFIERTYQQTKIRCDQDSFLYLTTKVLENFKAIKDESLLILVNLTSINNILSINNFFTQLRKKVKPGGILVGSFSPLEEDYKRLRNKMPRFLYTFISPFHFLLFRFFPKIPIIGTFYDFVTQGKGRFLSKAEVYGRLSYCGFEMLDSILINHKLFFIARRKESVSNEKNPSFGPIVKLKRVAYSNKIITIYKFRTMHPYSEFIQKEIVENNNLDKSGKIKNDFRVTSWGKVMRKLWIDEIPQIVNWLQGDISIVGVRALSQHYFSLYPKDLQRLRTTVKPGLIPPYYADMPRNFEEIMYSERKYLKEKLKNRFRTDIIYFFRAFNNIVFKGERSQ